MPHCCVVIAAQYQNGCDSSPNTDAQRCHAGLMHCESQMAVTPKTPIKTCAIIFEPPFLAWQLFPYLLPPMAKALNIFQFPSR